MGGGAEEKVLQIHTVTCAAGTDTHTTWCQASLMVLFPSHSLRQWFHRSRSVQSGHTVHGSSDTVFSVSPLKLQGSAPLHMLVLLVALFSEAGLCCGTGLVIAGSVSPNILTVFSVQQFTWSFVHSSYSKDIKFVGTCCLLLWQAALRCLNHSKAFILFPAWYL